MATLVLLHGFAATNFTWRDVEGPLREAGHEVVALERSFVSYRAAVSMACDNLDRRKLGELVLVGHSAGADIAVGVAARNPGRICGLVLAAPVIGGGPPEFVRMVASLPVVRNVAPHLLRLGIRVGLPYALKQTWVDKSRVTNDVVKGFGAPLLEPGVAEALWSMTAHANPTTPDWDAVRAIPALVVKGDADKWVTPVPLPRAETVTYERCGHLPHEECADRFVADVLRFVEKVT